MSSVWSFYDPVTGAFNGRIFSGPADQLVANSQQGFTALLGQFDPMSQRYDVASGKVVSYQPTAPVSTALVTWAWDAALQRWVPKPTLASLKIDKWAAIKAKRDASIALPKTTTMGQFDATPEAQNNLNKVIALVQVAQSRALPATANFTLATNLRVLFTLTQLQTAALEMGSAVQTLYDTADAIRLRIEAATDAATLDTIVWTGP